MIIPSMTEDTPAAEPAGPRSSQCASFSSEYVFQPLAKPTEFRLLSAKRKEHIPSSPPSLVEGCPALSNFEFCIIAYDSTSPECPPYEAISYVWGDPSLDYRIELQEGTYLPATGSVAEGLAHWAHHSETGHLWIDQVCINQKDILEKNQQVQMMGTTYEHCTRALIWLGDKLVGSDCVSGLEMFVGTIDPDELANQISKSQQESAIYQFISRNREDLRRVYRSPWFQRSWVFQEALLPASAFAILGKVALHVDKLIKFMLLIAFHDTLQMELAWEQLLEDDAFLTVAGNLLLERGYRHNAWSGLPVVQSALNSFWYITRSTAATDPRDKIYAFARILEDVGVGIHVDYSLSMQQVYCNSTLAIIKQTGRLDVLMCRSTTPPSLGLPTWALDPTQPVTHSPVDMTATHMRADRCRRHVYVNSHLSHKLVVRGLAVDRISSILIQPHDYPSTADMLSTGWVDNFKLQMKAVETSASFKRIATVLYDEFREGVETPGDSSDSHLAAGRDVDSPVPPPPTIRISDIRHGSGRMLVGPMFLTVQGRLAVVTKLARDGDVVVILHGLRVPIILRSMGDGTHQIIGCAYVENVMRGEACNWRDEDASTFYLV